VTWDTVEHDQGEPIPELAGHDALTRFKAEAERNMGAF